MDARQFYTGPPMRIGELSEITGVSIPTIRLYEREGLIEPAERTSGRFREFNEEQRLRLDFIKRVRNLGFTLDEVKVLLALSSGRAAGENSPLVERFLSGIRDRKRDLGKLEDRISLAVKGVKPFDGMDDAFHKS